MTRMTRCWKLRHRNRRFDIIPCDKRYINTTKGSLNTFRFQTNFPGLSVRSFTEHAHASYQSRPCPWWRARMDDGLSVLDPACGLTSARHRALCLAGPAFYFLFHFLCPLFHGSPWQPEVTESDSRDGAVGLEYCWMKLTQPVPSVTTLTVQASLPSG